MSQIQVRINGRGNAWPVIIGEDHPFYDRCNYEDMANASCSIIKASIDNPATKDVEWDLMIDAGHGAVQYLLKYCNRIPEALFLTHHHIDHTLGIDWIIQSYYKLHQKPYPVYATRLCWEKTKQAFPQLTPMVDFKELIPFKEIIIDEAKDVSLIPFPVYHGQSAEGASMLYFKVKENDQYKRILITGDILCPLLREQDYDIISNVDILVADANNRFPYPKSNHWSILNGVNNQPSEILNKFIMSNTIAILLFPHLKKQTSDNYSCSFDYFFNNQKQISDFQFSIYDFVRRTNPKICVLVHYSGTEDEKYYNHSRLSDLELNDWLNKISQDFVIKTKFVVPYVGQHMNFLNVT